jgi:hypothetical protein
VALRCQLDRAVDRYSRAAGPAASLRTTRLACQRGPAISRLGPAAPWATLRATSARREPRSGTGMGPNCPASVGTPRHRPTHELPARSLTCTNSLGEHQSSLSGTPSFGLLIRRLWVRVPRGPPCFPRSARCAADGWLPSRGLSPQQSPPARPETTARDLAP